MIRFVKPEPAALVSVATILAPKISSFGEVVVAFPLFEVVLLPVAAAVTSSTLTPRYSRTRTSGYAAAGLNVTVTVVDPPLMFDA